MGERCEILDLLQGEEALEAAATRAITRLSSEGANRIVIAFGDDARRAWTAMFNAFLHPAMERILYNAEHQLRQYKSKKPLLIFRNDGHSARVARSIAIRTYSSGPRQALRRCAGQSAPSARRAA